MALQHADIIVSDGQKIIHISQESIVYTGMLIVMKSRRYQATHFLQVVHLQPCFHTWASYEVVEGLTDICRVRLIMVCDKLVAGSDRSKEVHHAIEINLARAYQSMPRKYERNDRYKFSSVG